MQRWFISIDKR